MIVVLINLQRADKTLWEHTLHSTKPDATEKNIKTRKLDTAK